MILTPDPMEILIIFPVAALLIAFGWWLHSEVGGSWVRGSGHHASDPSHLRIRIRGWRMRFTDDALIAARKREVERTRQEAPR